MVKPYVLLKIEGNNTSHSTWWGTISLSIESVIFETENLNTVASAYISAMETAHVW